MDGPRLRRLPAERVAPLVGSAIGLVEGHERRQAQGLGAAARRGSDLRAGAVLVGGVVSVLMRDAEIIISKEAVFQTGKSAATTRRLCRRHGLARQTAPCAPSEISRAGLKMALHGDVRALERPRAGDSSAQEVRRYSACLGLQL